MAHRTIGDFMMIDYSVLKLESILNDDPDFCCPVHGSKTNPEVPLYLVKALRGRNFDKLEKALYQRYKEKLKQVSHNGRSNHNHKTQPRATPGESGAV